VPVAVRDPRLQEWRDRLVGVDGLAQRAEPVVVACSGGADSIALLAMALDAGFTTVAVHVDHGIRSGSGDEAGAVSAIASRLGAPARSETVTVAAGSNLEARARAARYEALEQARVALGASAVLLGHTADDQAETVLLNLLRGSAGAGLAGMSVRREQWLRPLLGLRRADTTAICAALGIEPLHDPMNDDRALRRVWVRLELIPLLSATTGRDLVPVLARQADVLRTDSEYLDELARAAWPPDPTRAPASTLAQLPPALARRAVRQWLGSPPPSFAEVERVLGVARGDTRGTELTGARRVARRRGQLRIERGSVQR
jgi:tRNA(Ile)-lysidine synthase